MGKKKGKKRKKRPSKKEGRLILETIALIVATIYYLIQIFKEL